jgi:hypothetical protein
VGIVSFHDVAKAVLEERNLENKLLKAYIKGLAGTIDVAAAACRPPGNLTNRTSCRHPVGFCSF